MREFLRQYGFIAALVLLHLAFSAMLVPIAVDDIRMADVFSVDESGAAAELRYYYTTGRLDKTSFKYGSLFYYVPLALLHVYSLAAPVTDRVILICLRSFGALSGSCALVLIYLLGRRLYDAKSGAAAAVIVGTTTVFLRWSVESHPDLPQMLGVCAFLWALTNVVARGSRRSVVLAAVWAAVAFNIKYVGLFLMPVLVLAVLTRSEAEEGLLCLDGLRALARWKTAGLAMLVFLGAAAVTNPYAAVYFGTFVQSLRAEGQIMAFGHSFRASGGFGAWASQTASVVGRVNVAVLAVGGGWMAYRRLRPRPIVIFYIVWVAGYLTYLSLFSQLIRPRHVIPVLPALALFCGGAYRFLWDRLSETQIPSLRLVMPALLIVGVAPSVQGGGELAALRLARADDQDEIQAGRWLAKHYGPETSILYDSYAYVPGKFTKVARTFGMTYMAIEHFRPRVLVVRDAIVSDYADTSKAREARSGRVAYLDSHYFYRYLKEGGLREFRLVKSFARVSIYESIGLEARPIRWPRLMAMFGSGKPLGVAAARKRMSDAHLIAGRHDEASEQRRLAHKAQSYALGRFNSAKELLAEGDLTEARAAFDEVLAMVEARPDSYRAAIHQHVSRTLFEAGYYREAIAETRRALDLHDLEDAHFELGIFMLASGDVGSADSVFAAAVKRFGKSAVARNLLHQLAQNEIAPVAARRAIQTHFSR